MFFTFSSTRSGLIVSSACLLLGFASTARAVPITLNADGTDFGAEMLTGTSNVGVIFYHGRAQSPTGDVVRQLQNNLNANGYTTLSLADPIPPGGTGFGAYDSQEDIVDDEVFARLDAALVEMASNGVEHVVLSGFSLGARFMTASAAAWQAGIFAPSTDIDLLGLVGAGMYGSFSLSDPTASNPVSLNDFNVLDTHSNLAFIDSIPVLDLYGSHDVQSVANADIRRSAYGGDSGMYVQAQLDCPPNDGTYYARAFVNGVYTFQPYYLKGDKRCHQLRDGWTLDANGNYIDTFHVRTNASAPLQSTVDTFFARYIEPHATVPEPDTLLLMFIGLSMLLLARTKRSR